MDNKKILKLIIAIIIILIALAMILSITINKSRSNYNSNSLDNPNQVNNNTEQGSVDEQSLPTIVEKMDQFFTIDTYMENYITAINEKDTETLLKYLRDEYIEKNDITQNNVFTFLISCTNVNSYLTKEVFYNSNDNYAEYYIKSSVDGNDFYTILGNDLNNSTLDLYPIDKTEYQNIITMGRYSIPFKTRTISKKSGNFYANQTYSDQDIAKKYCCNYINMMLNYTKGAYELLGETTKEEKFTTYEKFNSFVVNNSQNLNIMYNVNAVTPKIEFAGSNARNSYNEKYANYIISNYSKNYNGETINLICQDENGNKLTFNIEMANPGNYTVDIG